MLGSLVSLFATMMLFLSFLSVHPCPLGPLLQLRAAISAISSHQILGLMLMSCFPIVSQPFAVVLSLKKDANAAPTAASAVPTVARAIT